jgi:hypothetical protein
MSDYRPDRACGESVWLRQQVRDNHIENPGVGNGRLMIRYG